MYLSSINATLGSEWITLVEQLLPRGAGSSGLLLTLPRLLCVIQHPVVLLLGDLRVNILWSPAED